MDDTTFEYETRDVVEGVRRFPAHKLTRASGHPDPDLEYLTHPSEFGTHAWDEGGHF